jgi:hypothetical protein
VEDDALQLMKPAPTPYVISATHSEGTTMKRKSPRGIPDFSSKRGKGALPDKNAGAKPAQATPPPAPKVKPQATSAKSGNRGG